MGLGGTGGGGQPGQIQGSDRANAMVGTQMSDLAMQNRYQQLGLGGVGATPTSEPVGGVPGVPGSGTSAVSPGQFATGTTTVGGSTGGGGGTSGANLAQGAFGNPVAGFGGLPATSGASGVGLGGTGTAGGVSGGGGFTVPTGGPTAFEQDIGQAPSWTGGIPQEFMAALGEGQFQDLGETTQAAVASQQAKGAMAAGIGQLIGGI